MTARLWFVLLASCLGLTLVLPVAQAAPIGQLSQFRLRTPNSDPRHITPAADGNLWFTTAGEFSSTHVVGRITPRGDITEFPVCSFCFPNDIVEGPDGNLYFTQSDSRLGRISTSGAVLADVVMPGPETIIANGIAADSTSIWFTDYLNNRIGRYDVFAETFAFFDVPTAGANPFDLAVAPDGTVWFAEFHMNQVGELDPALGVVSETPVSGDPRQITVAVDGTVWFTERFTHAIGRLTPSGTGAHQVAEFPTAPGAGPEDIAAAPDGNLWFTQYSAGNIARISPSGVITEGKSVKGSGPYGITIAPDGNPWYAMLEANKIATLRLR